MGVRVGTKERARGGRQELEEHKVTPVPKGLIEQRLVSQDHRDAAAPGGLQWCRGCCEKCYDWTFK